MRHLAILSLVLVTGCTQVSGVVDTVRGGLGGLGMSTTRQAEEAPPLPPAADSVPDEPPVAVVPQAADGGLGRTVVGLGDPGKTGLWLETPLVTAGGRGRVVWPTTGRWVAVALIPADGAVTAGSRLSLEAFRILGAPLTDLIEVEVYAEG
ncbi:MAG: hypothetical protein P1U75_02320 [Antarcticimicrobium sp.]|uniref:hypothetical protein n=1 Tax=Antarcticimicrobium sp. TaxID=2824147 RepID=UPI002620EB1C|nr:hypothetical protein [Antarcticimicrobium sp.]MDF1715497.1 hypothetical protein [Antarcticimicrobium sp.]